MEHRETPESLKRHGLVTGDDAVKPFGAVRSIDATTFRVWAPAADSVNLVIEGPGEQATHALHPEEPGVFATALHGVGAGTLYRYSLNGGPAMPDPASRFQPFGVHGPSEVIDPGSYRWQDRDWTGIDFARAVIYELHVGTFTRGGTFARAAERLQYLRDLGVTVIELMPLADFPGERNWGYDVACLYAPSRAYGRPEDLRHLVDAAHAAGIAVVLDVVYNHLGPDGAYLYAFAPSYLSSRHSSPWGQGVNLDGLGSALVRRFILDNARHWLEEYHFDGLRLDATHALTDESSPHIVAEIVQTSRRVRNRRTLLIAEDHRNQASMLHDQDAGGWGLDAVWADDFHHIAQRILAGDDEGYYEDYRASVMDLATTLQQGWFFTGQRSRYFGRARGTDPKGIALKKFIICLQNHDQVGNRAFGERLHRAIGLPAFRAASVLLLLSPETPLLFMGQEWAASTPFCYFTDHLPALGEQVVRGRRREFEKFSQFRDPGTLERIPDPQDRATFECSRLEWEERGREPHRGVWHLYRRCLELRANWFETFDARNGRNRVRVTSCGDDAVILKYESRNAELVVVSRLRGAGAIAVPDLLPGMRVILTSEDPLFAPDGEPPQIVGSDVTFTAPATVVFAWT